MRGVLPLRDDGGSGALTHRIAAGLRARNDVVRAFFAREAARLAPMCEAAAARFLRGGRLFAMGRGPYATDAAHVSVEFVHPVLVGKRALPALDVSAAPAAMLEVLAGADDIVVAFGPPGGDAELLAALARAKEKGALTFALPGTHADYAVDSPSADAHVHQEIFEILGHTFYEGVQVFLEHRERGHDVGASEFLYPFLGAAKQDTGAAIESVAESIRAKAEEGAQLREAVATTQTDAIAAAIETIRTSLAAGGRLLVFGNGGSATDATDFALDCVEPPEGMRPVAAISLAAEPAILTAVSNDVGFELSFLRQVIAQSRPGDVAFAMSTSGGSKNVAAALGEARKRGLATVALLGYDGGAIAREGLADHVIVVNCDYIPRIQETQAAIYHVMRAEL